MDTRFLSDQKNRGFEAISCPDEDDFDLPFLNLHHPSENALMFARMLEEPSIQRATEIGLKHSSSFFYIHFFALEDLVFSVKYFTGQ